MQKLEIYAKCVGLIEIRRCEMKLLAMILATCLQVGEGDWSGMDAVFHKCDYGYTVITLTRQEQKHPLFFITENRKEIITWKNTEEDGNLKNATMYAITVKENSNTEK